MNQENAETQTIESSDVETVEAAPQSDAQRRAQELLAARGSKTTSDSAEAGQGAKAPKEKKERVPKATVKKGYRFLRDIDPTIDKFNKQQTILIDTMLQVRKADGPLKDVVLRDELLANLSMEKLASRQPPERVFGFYLNGWKKNIPATEKKAKIPAIIEVVDVTLAD